ncbi:MAG: TetR/AcrR family transcriptional regulator [Sneathiella sp.]
MNTSTSPRQRGSRDTWLNAAYSLLVSDGIDAVKVMPLAKHLNLSRTGFYWYFEDIAELHSAMIRLWETKNTNQLVDQCRTDTNNICQALFNLTDCWLNSALFDARLDLAIRNWARVDPSLQLRLSKADAVRIAAVTGVFRRFGYSEEQSEVRGMTVIYTQIGYISMQISEGWEERITRVQHYVELFAGVRPEKCDVENFINRHKHSSEKLLENTRQHPTVPNIEL